MSKLKPGDKVWMKGELDRIGSDGFVEMGHWWNHDVKYLIPDVPNLAAVARVLVANPWMAETLARATNYIGNVHGEWNDDPYADDIDQWGDDIGALGQLERALKGGAS